MGFNEKEAIYYLESKKDYYEILKRLVQFEDAKERSGWIWSDVKVIPAKLMKLVTLGLLDITYRSTRTTRYRVSEFGRKILRTLEARYIEKGR